MSNGCEDPKRTEPTRGPAMIVDRPELEVDEILAYKMTGIGKNRHFEYFVRWKGGSEEDGCWEREEALWKWKHKIREFG
jgi:hypothetical protein